MAEIDLIYNSSATIAAAGSNALSYSGVNFVVTRTDGNDDIAPDDYASDTTTTGVVAVGGSATGELEVLGDTDWFRVTLDADTLYTFTMRAAGSGGGTLDEPFLELVVVVDFNPTTWVVRGLDYGTATEAAQFVHFNQSAGTYYLIADAGSFLGDTGTYTVSAAESFTAGADNVTVPNVGTPWNALDGNDTVRGSQGGDTILGSAGDDRLFGNSGADVLDGGTDNDVLQGDSEDDQLSGGDGNDRIVATFLDGADTLSGGTGFDTLDYSALPGPVSINQFAGTTTGTAGRDVLTDVFEEVLGTAFNDTLAGGHGVNSLSGNGGNDLLFGNGGSDLVRGGSGDDTVFMQTSDGDDTIEGGAGFDLLDFRTAAGVIQLNMFTGATTGTAGNDQFVEIEYVIGSAFGDVIAGNHGVNAFDGGGGADQLWGNGGDDWIRGGTGDDTVTLGPGNDTYYFRNGDGVDTVIDFVAGGTSDKLDLTSAGSGYADFAAMQSAAGAIAQSGLDTLLNLDPGGGAADRIVLKNVAAGALTAADFQF